MTFNPNARLDPGQITDRRGMGGRGGLALGGGGLGLVVLLVYMLLGGNPNDLGGALTDPGAVTGPGSTALATDCQTGQDANTRDDCRILGYVNSVQAYWTDDVHRPPARRYEPVDTVLFTDVTSTRLRDRQRGHAGRSTARTTGSSTSTSASSTSSAPASGRPVARWPRAT